MNSKPHDDAVAAFRSMRAKERYAPLYQLLVRVWRYERHALERGCGRETLTHWVQYVTAQRVHPNELRRAAEWAERKGWCKLVREPMRCTRIVILNPYGW